MNRVFKLALTLAVAAQTSSSFFTPPSCARRRDVACEQISRIRLAITGGGTEGTTTTPDMGDVGFVLLAGGTGSRMKATMRELLWRRSLQIALTFVYITVSGNLKEVSLPTSCFLNENVCFT
jgi:hypothetical protein